MNSLQHANPNKANQAYFATSEKIQDIVEEISSTIRFSSSNDLGAVILQSPDINGYYGTIGRSLEVTRGFKEMPESMSAMESSSYFIYIFHKNQNGRLSITHSTRFLKPTVQNSDIVVQEIVDDIRGQATVEEISNYHQVKTPLSCLFVTTDLSSPGISSTRNKPYGLLAYKVLMNFSIGEACTHIFAYMNKYTLKSLGRMGIAPTPLCGKTGYTIPPIGNYSFEAYQPYVLTATEHNLRVFNDGEYARIFGHWAMLVAGIDITAVKMLDTCRQR